MLLGGLGGGLGRGNFIFGLGGLNYNYYTHLRASSGAGRDGLHRGGLDDVLIIDHVINLVLVRPNMLLGLLGSDFNGQKMYSIRYNVFKYNLMFYLGLRTREWVDAVGWVRMTTSRLGNRSQLGLSFAAGLIWA